jgi:hypothetical protein
MSTLEDPRERTLTWLETYWTPTNVLDDNGNSTIGLMMFEDADFPLELIFIDLTADYILTIGDNDLTPLRNADKTVSSYRENIPITVSLINKESLTAVEVIWKVERELRLVAETYIFGSVRAIANRETTTRLLGREKIYSFTYELSYTRDVV